MSAKGSNPGSKEGSRASSIASASGIGVTSKLLLRESLPPVRESLEPLRTIKPSLSTKYEFNGTISLWSDFVHEVQMFISDQNVAQADDNELLLIRPRAGPVGSTWCHYERDWYTIGEEKGVEGRFNHHVMNCLALAARLCNRHGERNPLDVQPCDFKATEEGRSWNPRSGTYPDIACRRHLNNSTLIDKGHLVVVGEVKADWKDDLKDKYVKCFDTKEQDPQKVFRPWITQIAGYMHDFKLRYGFITTYKHTVFVRMDHYHHSGKTIRKDTLLISQPIAWSDMYQPGKHVSVRLCVWYLMLKASIYKADRDHHDPQTTIRMLKAPPSPVLGTPEKGSNPSMIQEHEQRKLTLRSRGPKGVPVSHRNEDSVPKLGSLTIDEERSTWVIELPGYSPLAIVMSELHQWAKHFILEGKTLLYVKDKRPIPLRIRNKGLDRELQKYSSTTTLREAMEKKVFNY